MNEAGVRMIDAEDLSWKLASITNEEINKYIETHTDVTMIPIELVLEILENAE